MTENPAIFDPFNIFDILKSNACYYRCPIRRGRREGLLVASSETYCSLQTKEVLSKVQEDYFNLAPLEEDPTMIESIAALLQHVYLKELFPDTAACTVLAAPLDGLLFAHSFARKMHFRIKFTEREVVLNGIGDQRALDVALNRHPIQNGERIIIFEDVCDTLITLQKMMKLVMLSRANIAGVVCIVNRSGNNSWHIPILGEIIHVPIISLLDVPSVRYRQDDPYVARDICALTTTPRYEWRSLLEYMRPASL